MGPRRAAGLWWPLLALGCALGAAGAEVLPPPSELSYSLIQICTLNWTWRAPEDVGSSCDLWFSSDIFINEVSQEQKEWNRNLFRVTDVLMGEEMRFKVRSECRHGNGSEPSPWVETSVRPPDRQVFPNAEYRETNVVSGGIPGTAAMNLDCVWHNLEYMKCQWLAGTNARSDTSYTLFYWYEGLGNPEKCSNSSVHEGIFECIFDFSFPKLTNTYPTISILIKDASKEIRPLCANKNPTTLVKPATPKVVALSKVNDDIRLEWSRPGTFPASCLYYEVEYRRGDKNAAQIIKVEDNRTSIPSVDPDTKYTFRVRAKLKSDCYSSKLSSDWSEEKSIGAKSDSTVYFVLIITIPLIIAVSTIILLFYLKRLKILILPPVPDPREILKRMFGEQNEDAQGGVKEDSVNAYNRLIKEEEIHSLVLTETPGTSHPENDNR